MSDAHATGTILDTILAHKREEVAARQAHISRSEVQAQARDNALPRPFLAALRQPRNNRIGLIAEVKKASPSAGIIRADFKPVAIARAYETGGADCLSVLTDERFFQGHDNYLRAVREAVALPLLRKDFVVDGYQIDEARALGADAVLLIVAALTATQVREYQARASAWGMAALVEVHTSEEMGVALAAEATLIGINNRDLSTFVTRLSTTEELAAHVPAHVTLVAESGLKTPADVAQVAQAGARAILVGEALMRAPDIRQAILELMGQA